MEAMTGPRNRLRPRVAPWVLWSVISGLLSLGCLGIALVHAITAEGLTLLMAPALAPLAICAIVAARAATRAIDTHPERYRGRRAAVAGAVLGWSAVVVCALSLLTVLAIWLASVVH